MICDPSIEVICDECGAHESIVPKFTYGGVLHTKGAYDCDYDSVIRKLERDYKWKCRDGRHFCEECGKTMAGREEDDSE